MAITRQLRVLSDDSDIVMLRVGFASSDGHIVDQHFGSARAFAIYGLNPDRAYMESLVEFDTPEQDATEDKLMHKLALLNGCIAVYCRACGASAVRQLLAQNIQPVKVTDDTPIAELIEALQTELREGPSSWLAKAIKRNQGPNAARFDEMEAEGWQD